MIIAINQQPYDGPWGGGNRFVQALVEGLSARGHSVVHHLSCDVDIILMVETRMRSPNVTFGVGAILRHLVKYPQTLVVHRINECDERKGEKFITDRLLRANYAADFTVFVGSWLMDLPAWKNKDRTRCDVILNGADRNIFHAHGFVPWDGAGPVRFVTHHWGYHRFKGFDVYEHIDRLLEQSKFSEHFSMSYMGRLPDGYNFKNIDHISPLDGEALAERLRGFHAYLTGSINEPGGNHQNEGASCGLPIVYRRSGCMPEYCDGFGVGYNGVADVEAALYQLRGNYAEYCAKVAEYPHTSDRMIADWITFFDRISAQKSYIASQRKIWRNIPLFLINQILV